LYLKHQFLFSFLEPHKNRGIAKKNISEEAAEKLKEMIPLEYELYRFACQRLSRQVSVI
jgi:hypothetical protein